MPPQITKYIKVRTDARKSPFAIKVERLPKDNGPCYNLGPVPCIYAHNTRQIFYMNTHTICIHLLENEFVAQFQLLSDDYTRSAIKAINTYNEANRKEFVTVSKSQQKVNHQFFNVAWTSDYLMKNQKNSKLPCLL